MAASVIKTLLPAALSVISALTVPGQQSLCHLLQKWNKELQSLGVGKRKQPRGNVILNPDLGTLTKLPSGNMTTAVRTGT